MLSVALVLAGITVGDRVRGGSRSPTAVAQEFVAAVDDHDLGALVRLVDPLERPALLRVADAWSRQLMDLDLPDTAGGGPRPRVADALAGLEVETHGLRPVVSAQGESSAVVDLAGGTVRVRADPAQSRGLLRTGFALRRTSRPFDATYGVDELPLLGHARLVVVRRDHRWFLSVLGTLLADRVDPARVSGVVPTTSPASTGRASAEEAVQATVQGFYDALATHDAAPLAATLDPAGAEAVRLVGTPVVGGRDEVARDRVRTFSGTAAQDGPDRSVVLVRILEVTGPERLSVLGACATAGTERRCLRDSGYRYGDGTPGLGLFELLGHGGSFTLTAVRSADGWRTSLPESTADALIGYGAGLTRAQVLAVLGEARQDDPAEVLVPDQPRDVTFSSAGYALETVRVAQAGLYRVAPSPGGGNRATLYDPDGQPSIQPFFPNDSAYRLEPGDYTLLVWADDDFAATLTAPRRYVQRVEVRTVR